MATHGGLALRASGGAPAGRATTAGDRPRVLEAGFRFPRHPKWSLGFSDTSSLLLAQWAAGLPGAIHGSSGGTEAQWQRTVDLLCGRPVAPLLGEPRRRGIAKGPLVVTNLTVATHLIGTPWLPSLKGAILVLDCLLYTSPSPRDVEESRMPSSA